MGSFKCPRVLERRILNADLWSSISISELGGQQVSQHLFVAAVDLTADEIRDLRRHLGLVDTAGRNRMGRPLTKVLLVPFAGAIDKKPVDVLVDRVKEWLSTRTLEDRNVEIYGPDNKVVRVVKTGKEIQTSSEKDSKYRNRQARRIAALSRVRGFVLQLTLLNGLDHLFQHRDRLLSQRTVAPAGSVDA